ncbi:MAG TPA: hypothetical protein VFJ16_01015 [Longimicrobium sp.]|nr:hypothetical protein [Longimicrobium sp.]
MTRLGKHCARAAAVAGVLAALGCGGGGGDILAPFQPQVSAATDNFQFQVTGLTGIDLTRDYAWPTTGTRVDVNQATQLTGGSATVTLYDAANTQVYAHDLTANGTFQSSAGSTGTWRIRLNLVNARGNVNFRVQKHP